ncbi:cupin domain-containing protein [Leucobacter albus]|uniref:Cupin domain-containing protein n=1 Tax=Leucobacter albus TaxID=272210 RepID=A0ABW3TSB8_9MICO
MQHPEPEPASAALAAGSVVNVLDLELPMSPLPADEVRAGTPAAGSRDVAAGPGLAIGVWEMTAGTAVDTEADECFVVLTGRATVTIHAADPAQRDTVLELQPGSLGRLAAGMQTTWVVHEALRKVYLLPTAD